MNQRHLSAAALLAGALVLTACGGAGDRTVASAPTSAASTAATGQYNDADATFLTGMKPHHAQAVEMSDMVLSANPPAAVAALARKIKAEQAPEIDQMTKMLNDLGLKSDGTMSMGGMGAGGMGGPGGSMSDAMMAELDAATGTQAAKLYLQGMIRHHMGAISSAETEIAGGKYAPAVELAKAIKAAQSAEIPQMQALLATLQ